MNTPLNTQTLDGMAWTISKSGFDSIPAAALRELGFEARRAGVSASVAHTLVDSNVPLVVRQRAFGHIASKVGGLWQQRRPGHQRHAGRARRLIDTVSPTPQPSPIPPRVHHSGRLRVPGQVSRPLPTATTCGSQAGRPKTSCTSSSNEARSWIGKSGSNEFWSHSAQNCMHSGAHWWSM